MPGDDDGGSLPGTPANAVTTNSHSMPACTPTCGELGLVEIAECSQRGIYCSTDRCALHELRDRQLARWADSQWRIAELTVVADYYAGRGHYLGTWVAAQLRDLRDLLEAGVGQ